jgi:hypothetical protein
MLFWLYASCITSAYETRIKHKYQYSGIRSVKDQLVQCSEIERRQRWSVAR